MTPSSPSPRKPRADAWLVVAAVLMLCWTGYRAWLAERALAVHIDCRGCLAQAVVLQDLWLLAGLLAIFLLARLAGSRLLAAVLAAVSGLLALAFVADVVVYRLLNRRLMLEDVWRYGDEVGANLSVLEPLLATPAGIAILVGGLALVLASAWSVASAPAAMRHWRGVTLALVAVLAAAWIPGRTYYLNRHAYENVLAINRGDGMSRPYGEAVKQRLRDAPAPAMVCETGQSQRMPVIVLVVESWSLHHSALFSGLSDLTPELDALAREGSYYPDFIANGFSTEGGLIALLTGAVPVSTLEHGSSLVFHQVYDDFHRRLAADGWRTRFFTTGTLDFGERERWLRSIGIAEAEGDRHPAYEGMPRGPFNAASDQALFDRFLQWYDHERDAAPFMATLLTVGMHPPFVDLSGGPGGEQVAVKTTDAAIGRFVRGLRERGFLDDGLLFVVGDHRTMTPLHPGEFERYGEAAMMRVPALVLGASGLPQGRVPGGFQQADLLPSLQWLLGARACRRPWQGRLFGPQPVPAPLRLYADPLRYDQVRVRAGEREHVLVLDGDDSRWLGPAPGAGFDVALEVARQRIARDRPPPP